jgi:TonB family protein
METFALYLLKSVIWLIGFCLIYVLFLRNERFFTLNRIFLITGMVASLVFPIFTWHYTVVFPVVPTINTGEAQIQEAVVNEKPAFQLKDLLVYIYLLGSIFLIFKIIMQLFSIWRIIRRSECKHFNSVRLIQTSHFPASFSFFSFVFVNPSINATETNEIVNHETGHVEQRHWVDLLLFEIVRTVQWFNPVCWLYGHLIRQNHEFLADERALRQSSNPAVYRAALLNQMFGGPVISLANSFNYSINKKRFNMMTKTIHSPFRKLKLFLVVPLIAGVFYAFAAPEYKFAEMKADSSLPVANTQQKTTVKGKVVTENGKPLPGTSIVIKGTTVGTMPDTDGNFKIEVTDQSTLVFSFVGFRSQEVKPEFDKEMRIVMKRESVGIDAVGNVTRDAEIVSIPGPNAPLLIFVDGKEVSEEEMKKIDPKKIDRIDVLKNKELCAKYGEKGKNGVILITTKKGQSSATETSFKKGEEVFVIVEEMPEFPGGAGVLHDYLNAHFQYPKEAIAKGIQGKVFVTFIVSKTGAVTGVKIEKGVDPLLDNEAVRLVKTLPKWKPGAQRGVPVDVAFTIPVEFNLPKK